MLTEPSVAVSKHTVKFANRAICCSVTHTVPFANGAVCCSVTHTHTQFSLVTEQSVVVLHTHTHTHTEFS